MLDRELLSAFSVFLGNLPRKEELSALVEVGKREARERLAAMPYETVTSYCFSK